MTSFPKRSLVIRAVTVVLIGGAVVPATVQAASEPAVAEKPAHELSGVWVVESVVNEGSREALPKDRLTIQLAPKNLPASARQFLVELHNGKKLVPAGLMLCLDPTKTPAWIDMHMGLGPCINGKSLGIYEFKGDRLRICLGVDVRPTDFTSRAKSKRSLIVLRRSPD